MAKRILTYGDYNVAECSECHCVFAFDSVDAVKDTTGEKTIVTCPQCGVECSPKSEKRK